MALFLEVEFLLGVAFLAKQPALDEPDWPPQPDRIFSALVAAWAARGERTGERAALEWLEKQEAPRIAAGPVFARSAPTVYVPPNDPDSGRKGNLRVLPDHRSRQPRRFPAGVLADPIVKFIWPDAAPDAETFAALDALARDVAYVGHSSSLTRCQFSTVQTDAIDRETRPPARRVYDGRLEELCAAFPVRWPAPGAPVAPRPEEQTPPQSVFGANWIVLEHLDGPIPDLRACAVIAKRIREALLAGFDGAPIPEILSGHTAEGAPSLSPHLAIVPMAYLGYRHADGGVHGFALVMPRAHEDALDAARRGEHRADVQTARSVERDFSEALGRVSERDERQDRQVIRLYSSQEAEGGAPATAAFSFAFGGVGSGKASLRPARYLGPARLWATATPVVLDRHLKTSARAKTRGDGEARAAEIADIISNACENIGLPRPVRIVPDKHSAIAGAPSAYPSGNAPGWMKWRVPEAFRTRSLTHAIIEFADPVQGPLILGAARHLGLGFCLPLNVEGGR